MLSNICLHAGVESRRTTTNTEAPPTRAKRMVVLLVPLPDGLANIYFLIYLSTDWVLVLTFS